MQEQGILKITRKIIGTDGKRVKRRNWLIATLTAFFVLQAPLCAFACLLAGDSQATAEEHSEVSCHDPAPAPSSDSSSSPAPPEPIVPHDQCSCGDTLSAAVPGVAETLWNSLASAAIPSGTATDAIEVDASRIRPITPGRTDLPPPDILLLKSSFLI